MGQVVFFFLEKLSCNTMYIVLRCTLKGWIILDKEMMKGSIDLLLLSLIEQRDLYGYEITKILKRLSNDTYEMSEGTLYPALKRLERKLWIESYWMETEVGRRKYYRITTTGIEELKKKRENWHLIESLVKKSSEGLQ